MEMVHQLTKLRYIMKAQIGLEFSDDKVEQVLCSFYKIPYLKRGINCRTRKRPIVISLTTIPSRIDKVWITIESLLRQSQKPDRILLWLAEDEFEEKKIPEILKKQQKRGLEIRYCKNLRSYKKFYYTMLAYPDAYVLLVDDDHIYSEKLVEEMWKASKLYPCDIICNRSHKIRGDNNGIFPYLRWLPFERRRNIRCIPSFLNFFTGNAGVMFPVWLFDRDVFRKDVFMEIAPTADDVWLNLNAWKSNIKIVNTESILGYAIPILSSSDTGLTLNNTTFKTDKRICENDIQINRVLDYLNLDFMDYI